MTRKANKKPGGRKVRLVPHDRVYARWRKHPDFQKARAELAGEFALAARLIRAQRRPVPPTLKA